MAGPLRPYRVLDLSNDSAWLTGKILADLGADVIKVEPPGGDPGRHVGPFAGGDPHPEKSLRWWFFNRGKRSVTLDPATADGRELLLALSERCDALIESFAPGTADAMGIGFHQAAARNARLVYTSVTPFGQLGPHAHFQSSDLILGSAGGQVWLTGDPDRPPVRISVPQYALHGAAEAAVHTTVALYHAAATGEGQHVDVAAQLAVIRTLMNATGFPTLEGRNLARAGGSRASSAAAFKMIYACADGHVTLMLGGLAGVRGFTEWMREEIDIPAWLADFDWEDTDFAEFIRSEDGRSFFRRVAEIVEGFVANKTKHELYEGALQRRFLLAPVNTTGDIRTDPQLAFRDYFQPVAHDEGEVAYPGAWAKLSATPLEHTPRAPRIGEHTAQVLGDELGLSLDDLVRLAGAGVA